MSDKYLKSLTFPDLADRYVVGDSSLSVSGAAADAKATGDALATKAEVDGAYESMTVGNAEQLVGTTFEEDSVPYNFRTSGGSIDIGDREYLDKIVGGTVAWNQLAANSLKNCTPKKDQFLAMLVYDANYTRLRADIVTGHKYLLSFILPADCSVYRQDQNGFKCNWAEYSAQTSDRLIAFIGRGTATTANADLGSVIAKNSTTDTAYGLRDVQLIDLTAMFGSTIADYIYSLEQANAGAGVAWFKKLFPNDYYEYNAGELLSVSGLESHDTVGFNALPLTAESKTVSGVTFTVNSNGTITTNGTATADIFYYLNEHMENYLIPNNQYYIGGCPEGGGSSKYGIEILYGRDPVLWARDIGSGALFTATRSENLRVEIFITNGTNVSGLTFKPCINLSWSGYRNGEYEPYEKHSYPLDNSLTLRGIPKLDASNNLYYDGDEYQSDGSVSRRYGIVTIDGSTAVASSYNNSGNTAIVVQYTASDIKQPSDGLVAPLWLINSYGLEIEAPNRQYTNNFDCISVPHNTANRITLTFKDVTTVDAVKQKLTAKPLTIVYELATPTTETADVYNEIQICDDFGTEEFVSDSIVPVGHETRYPANLRDKLQHLPDLADADGYYMISQQNNNMSLELFRIPKAPTTDGNYTLKATVSGGTPTYTWESESEGE